MATSIHHGPPGSYKSFTLVQRFALPALKEGRVVVTNIRGFDNVDRCIEQFPNDDFSQMAKIIWIDTTTQAGRTKMAKWFHWVPFGALIIIDEVQQVYPDRRDFKLESLDKYQPEEGEIIEDIGLPEGRPEDVFTAYDKQRHYNWDIYCSTPNIAKVKKEIREVSEWAYRHRDISGLLPWKKNTWIEHQHDPESSGKVASHRVGSPTQYKADPRIFKCYASTATGEHVKSKAGRSILQDRKILGLALLILGCIGFFIYTFVQRQHLKDAKYQAPEIPVKTIDTPSPDSVGRVDNVAVNTDNLVKPNQLVSIKYLDRDHALKWSIHGLKPDELTQVPTTCRITRQSVKCTVPHDVNLLRVAFNHVCYPAYGSTLCDVIFFVEQPKPIKPDEKETVLAKAMPF
ncbi:MAG: zonular occludens toxin family protein [Methylovulum sp.]